MLGGGDFSYGFGVFDFSYDKVKRAGRRLLIGFLSPQLALHESFVPLNIITIG